MTADAPGVRVREALEREGLLLVQDGRLPSVSTLVAGEAIRGSWWGHPSGKAIYAVLQEIAREPRVLTVSLVAGKRTLVAPALVPALLAMATSNAPWQTDGLPDAAPRLLVLLRRKGLLRLDEVPPSIAPPALAAVLAGRLDERLLARGGDVHTESGTHVKTLESWDRVAPEAGVAAPWPPLEVARAAFDAIAARWEREHGLRPSFPWDPAPPPPPRAKAKKPMPATRKPVRRKPVKRKAAKRKAARGGRAAKPRTRDERKPVRRPRGKRRRAAGR